MLSKSASILKINLNNIVNNYNFIKKQACGGNVAAVVKADAYGLGVEKIAPVLYEAGCDNFFVANLDEAVKLRSILPNVCIYVFHGISKNEEPIFAEYNLIPIINSSYQGKIWQNYLNRQCQKVELYIHIDSAMNRLGFKNIDDDFLKTNKKNIKMIFSHYACADEPDNEKNIEQLDIIKNIKNAFEGVPVSLANSSASFLSHDFQGDMLRVGLAIYGGNPTPNLQNPMLNVVELLAPILQINNIKKGDTIGYGASFKAAKNMVTATLPIGYADGYFRSFSNNSYCFYEGSKLPVVGRISMDLITIDITLIANKINIGDYVEVIGNNITISELAKKAGTIDYEILTSLGNRFKKTYSVVALSS